MESYTVLKFSPSKTKSSLAVFSPQRSKQPSPEKRTLPYTTLFLSPKQAAAAMETGSPVKKLRLEDGQERCRGEYFFCSFTLKVPYLTVK